MESVTKGHRMSKIPKFAFSKFNYLWIPIILLIMGYTVFIVRNVSDRGLFEYVGIDYRLWYSSGMIARYHGFSEIYNPELQSHYQLPLYKKYARISSASMNFWPLPLPNLPIFILPMIVLTIFPPITGFIIWSLINSIGTYTYLVWFFRRNNLPISPTFLLLGLLSLPAFLNIIFGQINLLLLISIGESITTFRKGDEFKTGAWLALLLSKPQTLLLLIPCFLIARKNKVIIGFLFWSLILLITSFLICGREAIMGPFRVITNWPTILGDSGTNFLSLANNVTKFAPLYVANSILILSTISLIIAFVKFYSTQGCEFYPEKWTRETADK
jgi:hypothetical protein